METVMERAAKKTAIAAVMFLLIICGTFAEESTDPETAVEVPELAFEINAGFPFLLNPEILFPISPSFWMGMGLQLAYPDFSPGILGFTVKFIFGKFPGKFAFYAQPVFTLAFPPGSFWSIFQTIELGVYLGNFSVGVNVSGALWSEGIILPGIKAGYTFFSANKKEFAGPSGREETGTPDEPPPEKPYSNAVVLSAGYPFIAGIGYLWKFSWIEFGPVINLYQGDWNLWYGLKLNIPLFKIFSINAEIDFVSEQEFILSFGIGVFDAELLASFFRDFDQLLYEDTEYSIGGKFSWEF